MPTTLPTAPAPPASTGWSPLDPFLPAFDISEHHQIVVRASPDATWAAACNFDIDQIRLVRAIIRAREILLGTDQSQIRPYPRPFLARMRDLGWGVLSETPGREIVMGAVTQPWEPNVVFRALPPAEFASFAAPGFVKIAWTLHAEPAASGGGTLFVTDTRAAATDSQSKSRFRSYWRKVSPGVWLIRWAVLRALRRLAERCPGTAAAPVTRGSDRR